MEDKIKIIELVNEFCGAPQMHTDILADRIIKLFNTKSPHPSDSDIDEASIEFAEKENTNGHDDYIRIMNAYGQGMKDMRDRMNGEMCLFMEWREENYTKTKKGYYHKGDFYKNDKPLTTEQLLQKFRSR